MSPDKERWSHQPPLLEPLDFIFRVQMFRLPAELPLRLGAAESLIERIAAGPVAELGRDRIGRDEQR